LKISKESALRKFPTNFIPIFYNPLYRGNAVARILFSHKECVWLEKWSLSYDEDYNQPLDWPESVDFFINEHSNSINTLIMAYDKVDTALHLNVKDNLQMLKNIAQAINKIKSGFVFIPVHPSNEPSSIFHICPRSIVLWASDMTSINQRPYHSKPRKMKPIEGCFNIDVSLLFSQDYETFLEEYIRIVRWLDLTPRINAVRAFILRYLEREQYIVKYLLRSGKSFNKI